MNSKGGERTSEISCFLLGIYVHILLLLSLRYVCVFGRWYKHTSLAELSQGRGGKRGENSGFKNGRQGNKK